MRESKIQVTNERDLFDGKFIKVIGRDFIHNGRTGLWECVKRKTFGKIVAVAAITPNQELILVKIFRVPIQGWIIELCAGLMDRSGETEVELAQKELLEETGYHSDNITHLMTGHFNAGLLADQMAVYLALDAIKIDEPTLETGEDIEVISVPLKSAHKLLENPPEGVSVDMKIFSVIYHPIIRRLY